MLNLERLQALQAVATFGSVTGAAEALHLTPSAVSQQLTKLQRDVGQRLLEPYGRGVRMTPAGALLAGRANAILAEVEQAESELDRQRDLVVGELEVAAFPTAARALLPGAVAALHAAHPHLSVRLSERQPEESIRLVAAGHLDLALVNDWTNAPVVLPEGIEQRLVQRDPVDLALPPDHRLADRSTVELTDLADDAWITWPDGSTCYDWLAHTLRINGLSPRIRHTASEHQTQLAMVAAGLGVAIVPRLGRGLTPGVRIVGLRPSFTRQVYLIWRSLASERPAVAATVGAVVAQAGGPRH